jgi:hypothetical protein
MMNIAEIIEQARVLSLEERRELINRLTDSLVEETGKPDAQASLSSREIIRARLTAAGRLSQTHIPASQERLPDPPPFILPPVICRDTGRPTDARNGVPTDHGFMSG